MTVYTKPYLTTDQQVALLQARGMSITDLPKAKACLSRIGYYRLSAYWFPFRQSEILPDGSHSIKDDFRPKVTFADIMALYVFDKKLRLIVLDALERVEIAIRTDVALLIGKYNPRAHRDPRYLHGNFARRQAKNSTDTLHHEWLSRQDKKFQDSREDFAKHFKQKYAGDYPPIWIDVELWEFGSLSRLYAGLQVQDRDQIANHYGINDSRVLESWMRCLNDVRNVCAHHSRLWNKPLVNHPKWPATGSLPFVDHVQANTQAKTRLYAAVLILQVLMKVINPSSEWGQRLRTHVQTLPILPPINMQNAGFPGNWLAEPVWQP